MSDQYETEKVFKYHPPSDEQTKVYVNIRDMSKELAEYVEIVSPHTRERDMALTKLEEFVMWANANVARNGLNDKEIENDEN